MPLLKHYPDGKQNTVVKIYVKMNDAFIKMNKNYELHR